MTFNQSDNTPSHRFRHEHSDRHFCQLVLNRAELGNRRAECLALPGVLQASREHVFRGPDHGRTQFQPPHVQDVERDHVPAPDFSQNVFHRHRNIVKVHRRSGAAGDAHLVFFRPAAHAGKIPLDQKCGELLSPDLGKHREQVGRAPVGDPHLLAIQHVVFSIGSKVGSCPRRQSI